MRASQENSGFRRQGASVGANSASGYGYGNNAMYNVSSTGSGELKHSSPKPAKKASSSGGTGYTHSSSSGGKSKSSGGGGLRALTTPDTPAYGTGYTMTKPPKEPKPHKEPKPYKEPKAHKQPGDKKDGNLLHKMGEKTEKLGKWLEKKGDKQEGKKEEKKLKKAQEQQFQQQSQQQFQQREQQQHYQQPSYDSGHGGGGATAQRRFCAQCGTPLPPPPARFCAECGEQAF